MYRITHRIIRSLVCVILSLVIAGIIPTIATAVGELEATNKDWTGYIPISTKYEFDEIRNNPNGKYYLTNDIVFDDEDFMEGGDFYNDGKGWKPFNFDFFRGVLDGNGYSIKNLYMASDDPEGAALYIFLNNIGTIRDLTISDSYMEALNSGLWGFVAGLVYNNNGSIINCVFDGTIMSSGCGAGISYINYGEIVGCANRGEVYGGDFAAGIAFENHFDATITNCMNLGIVSTTEKALSAETAGICCRSDFSHKGNGIFGCGNYGYVIGAEAAGIVHTLESDACVKNCFNEGYVLSNDNSASGIIYKAEDKETIVEGCWNSGIVLSTSYSAAGICIRGYSVKDCFNAGSVITLKDEFEYYHKAASSGIAYSVDSIENCYNIGEVYAETVVRPEGFDGWYNIGAVTILEENVSIKNCYSIDFGQTIAYEAGKVKICTPEEMTKSDTFVGFDFENVWEIDEDSYYPFPNLKDAPFVYAEELALEIPQKQIYLNGEELELDDLVVYADYNNGVRVELLDYQVYFDDTVKGWSPVIVDWYGMTAKYYVLNTGKESFLRGDVDENGQVNGVDGNIEKQLLAGIIIPDEDMKMYGDVNLDMEINAKDSNLLKQIISGVVSFK